MVQLKKIPDVWNNILKKNPHDLCSLDVILFKKQCKAKERKEKIGTFAGFDWADNEQEKQEKALKERLKERTMDVLLGFCDIFNLHYNSHVRKPAVIEMLLKFLQSPRDTTEEEQVQPGKTSVEEEKGVGDELRKENERLKLEISDYEKKTKDLENLLADSRKKVKELEEFTESEFQGWKKKECGFRDFMDTQYRSLKELQMRSEYVKQEVMKTRQIYSEEINEFGTQIQALVDAAQSLGFLKGFCSTA